MSKLNNQGWTFKRKSALVLSLLKNEITIVDACRQYDLQQPEVERWIKFSLNGCEQNLKSNAN